MTKGMRTAIDQAKASATTTQPARLAPGVHENVFYALRMAGLADESGWLTTAGRAD